MDNVTTTSHNMRRWQRYLRQLELSLERSRDFGYGLDLLAMSLVRIWSGNHCGFYSWSIDSHRTSFQNFTGSCQDQKTIHLCSWSFALELAATAYQLLAFRVSCQVKASQDLLNFLKSPAGQSRHQALCNICFTFVSICCTYHWWQFMFYDRMCQFRGYVTSDLYQQKTSTQPEPEVPKL